MNLETEVEVKRKLRKVADYNDSVTDQCWQYFQCFPQHEDWFISELEELHWRNKYIGRYRNHISLTAVPLANKIYEQLNIITFPFIHRVACRGWDTSGGTWAWAMDIADGTGNSDIGSCDPVKYCLQKNVKLYLLDGIKGNNEISAEKCK